MADAAAPANAAAPAAPVAASAAAAPARAAGHTATGARAMSAAASAGAAAAAAVAADKASKTKLLTDLAQEVSVLKKVRARSTGRAQSRPDGRRVSQPLVRAFTGFAAQAVEAVTAEMAQERQWIKETLKPGLNQMRAQLVGP